MVSFFHRRWKEKTHMNFKPSAQDLDPVVHGALLRLIRGQPEEFPGASEDYSLQHPEETPDFQPERIQSPPCRQPWSEIPVIEMLPAEYRAEAQRILESDPNARMILEYCKTGVLDCWEALNRLGINHKCREVNIQSHRFSKKEAQT
jgi:hypothetical protein